MQKHLRIIAGLDQLIAGNVCPGLSREKPE
jgi:hypothetical protein